MNKGKLPLNGLMNVPKLELAVNFFKVRAAIVREICVKIGFDDRQRFEVPRNRWDPTATIKSSDEICCWPSISLVPMTENPSLTF